MKAKPVCFIFGAGSPPSQPPSIAANDLVIAADGGYTYLQNEGIRVDALIGDFDSLGNMPKHENTNLVVQRLEMEKDQTDMFAALQYGLERGYSSFHLFGGTGGRFDHTFANIQCLAYLVNHGARGYLYEGCFVITAVAGELWLSKQKDGILSVFALGNATEGVTLRGLKYELEDARLSGDFPLGVSNEFIGQTAYIKAERGILLVVYPTGTKELEEAPISKRQLPS
ncbi:MAG: thiamine diphosphokinase [Eubacteriaceae bacterium]|nr:thiamine diphosphokinase [Eubacteriaceae bacterium]